MPLVGVLVGAFTTTGASVYLAMKKEKADSFLAEKKEKAQAAKDKRSRDNELKTAARLIAEEFRLARGSGRSLVKKKDWHFKENKFRLDAWHADRGVLARELPCNDWHAVAEAALAIEYFNESASSDLIGETDKSYLKKLEAGLEVMTRYSAKDPDPQS